MVREKRGIWYFRPVQKIKLQIKKILEAIVLKNRCIRLLQIEVCEYF